jgi:hypothetical protein
MEQIAKQQYESKALVDNRVKIQYKAFESDRTNIKALAEKRTEFPHLQIKSRWKLIHQP